MPGDVGKVKTARSSDLYFLPSPVAFGIHRQVILWSSKNDRGVCKSGGTTGPKFSAGHLGLQSILAGLQSFPLGCSSSKLLVAWATYLQVLGKWCLSCFYQDLLTSSQKTGKLQMTREYIVISLLSPFSFIYVVILDCL
mmetsp:Transcript_22325/g.29201  ORF Transcript_22325/g.29201 Transcript_22325/m.29201 type:complete len:139 (+) Transcript_22325:1868-2284(+)